LLRWIILWFCLTTTAFADRLIIEPEAGPQPIIAAIQQAHHTIHLVMYGFTHKPLLETLLSAQEHNRTVQILLEKAPYESASENKKTIEAFERHHLSWQGSIPDIRLIHEKALMIDGKEAIIMTFNFTHSAFNNQRNFALVVDDPSTVNNIEHIFSADWNHTPIHTATSVILLSPDNSRSGILQLIQQAKHTIKIYAQHLTDYETIGALAKAARKHKQVDIITSLPLRSSAEEYLTRAGVHLHYIKKYMIHAKVIMIDDDTALIGSTNLTRSSLDDNRELSVITTDKNIIQQLNSTFHADLQE